MPPHRSRRRCVVTWQEKATCRKIPLEQPDRTAIFYPVPKDRSGESYAKAVCSVCPVRVPCLLEGIGQPGIWGGFNEQERARMTCDLDENGHMTGLPVSAWVYRNRGCRCDGCTQAMKAKRVRDSLARYPSRMGRR